MHQNRVFSSEQETAQDQRVTEIALYKLLGISYRQFWQGKQDYPN
jgi:hypothetical protein